MAKRYFRLTSATKDMFDTWYAKAVNDDEVWPYLSLNRRSFLSTVDDDDWDNVRYMDLRGNAVLSVSVDRASFRNMNISIWSLPGPSQGLAVGSLLTALPELCNRYGNSNIICYVHASNTKSLNLMNRLLGPPWGIEPEGAWNGLLGKFEYCHSFKCSVNKLRETFKDKKWVR